MTKFLSPKLPSEGGCRCGRVRLRISAAPLLTSACHCTGCQRMTSSAFSLSAAIPTPGFEIIQGKTVTGGLHGPAAHHHFCAYCMSWMFTRTEGMDALDGFVNLRSATLDDPSWFAPFVELMTSEKLPWAVTPAMHSFHKFPAFEDFPALIKEYSQASA